MDVYLGNLDSARYNLDRKKALKEFKGLKIISTSILEIELKSYS